MTSQDGVQKQIGDNVWVAGFCGKDTFYKPIPKALQPNYQTFYSDFQNCVMYCMLLNKANKKDT